MSARPTFAELFVAELRNEAAITRRFIAAIPPDKLDWKPHAKSHTAGALAMHIASMPRSISAASTMEFFPVDNIADGAFPNPLSVQQILDVHDTGLVEAEKTLASMSDADYALMWNATLQGKPVMTIPRHVVICNILFNHTCHHRGQLGVYLRVMGAHVPSSYGPSGDEMPPMLS